MGAIGMNRLIVGLIAGVLAGLVLGVASQTFYEFHPITDAEAARSPATQQGWQVGGDGEYGFAFYRRSRSHIH